MKKEKHLIDIDERFISIDVLIKKGKYVKATKLLHKLYFEVIKINYKGGILFYYDCYIEIQHQTWNNFLAIQLIQDFIKIIKDGKADNYYLLSRQYMMFGDILMRMSDFKNSSIYLKKALKYISKVENLNNQYDTNGMYSAIYVCLADNCIIQNKILEASEYIESGLKKFIDVKREKQSFKFQLLICKIKILIIKKEYVEAKKIIDLISKTFSRLLYKTNQIQYFKVVIDFQFNHSIKNHTEFIELVNSTLKLAIEYSEKNLIKELLITLKEYYLRKKKYKLSLKFANQIIENEINEKALQKDVLYSKQIKKINLTKFEKSEKSDYEIYHRSELDIAANYQRSFHSNKNIIKEINIQTLFKASKTLSGDYIGNFSLGNGYVLIVLADVVGKGITASYISFMLDGIIKSIIYNADSYDLKNIIKNINAILSDSLKNNGFVSLWTGIIDVKNKKLESINAGHLPTYLINKQGKIKTLSIGCTILGMFKDLPFLESEIIDFENGDSLIAYSDGIVEKTNSKNEEFNANFTTLLKKYAENKSFNFIKYLEIELDEFGETSQMNDDESCLLIEFK